MEETLLVVHQSPGSYLHEIIGYIFYSNVYLKKIF